MEKIIIALLASIVILKIFDKDPKELIFILFALLGLIGYKKVQIFRYKRNNIK